MKKNKTFYYLLEQDEKLPDIYKKIKAWTDEIKGLSDDDKNKLAKDPNGYGKKFWDKLIDLFKSINTSIPNPDAVLSKEIIENFKSELFKFDKIYDALFKPTFDKIAPVAATSTSTPSKYKTSNVKNYASDLGLGKDKSNPFSDKPKNGFAGGSDTESGISSSEPEKSSDGKASDKIQHPDSIIDYLDSKNQPSDFESRKILAQKMGIPEYKGTASQNLLMLNTLKSGKTEVPSERAEFSKAAPSPQINFAGSKQNVYVDMGGGRYAPATEDQLGDPNVQLYVKNPKKGQGEYLKPNYIKVRREGSDLRPQSQFGGILGSLSNFAGDVGNSLKKM